MASKLERRFILVRMIFGSLILASAWSLIGWLAMSEDLGLVLGAWSLVIGPLVVPVVLWVFWRLRGRVKALDLTRHQAIASSYFRRILKQPGPVPLMYSFGSRDLGIFWFENLFSRRQTMVVTTGWLALDPASQQKDFEAIWADIARSTRWERLRRTFQIALWFGPVSLLDLLFGLFHLTLKFMGYREMPDAAFWFMRILWSLRERWFGFEADEGVFLASKRQVSKSMRLPQVWQSALWGIWVQGPLLEFHPAWRIWIHRGAFLEGRSSR